MSGEGRLAPVTRPSTPADRARSLARSYLRLERAVMLPELKRARPPREIRQALAGGGEAMVQLADLLVTEGVHPNEAPALEEVLRRHDDHLHALHTSIVSELGPDDAGTLRRALLRVAISDTELHDRLRDVQAAEEAAEGARSPDTAPAVLDAAAPAADTDRLGGDPVARLEQTADGGLRITIGPGADGAPPALSDLARAFHLEPHELAELERLAGPIAGMLDPERLMADMEQQWRKEQDGRPVSLRVSLKAALSAQPAHWVEAVQARLGLPTRRRKSERVADIVAALRAPASLLRAVGGLPQRSRTALIWLLEEGGSVRRSRFVRRFGSDSDDGWFWLDDAPDSVLGQLRLHGLVFVGQARDGKQRVAMVVVPRDLRESLAYALGIATL